jgi:hypothetical protein
MQMERDYRRFDAAYEVIGIERCQEPGHVFDAERVGSQILKLFAMSTKRPGCERD